MGITKTVRLSSPITKADIKLLHARVELYKALWSCHGFLTGEKNINDALNELVFNQRRDIERRFIESQISVLEQLKNFKTKEKS